MEVRNPQILLPKLVRTCASSGTIIFCTFMGAFTKYAAELNVSLVPKEFHKQPHILGLLVCRVHNATNALLLESRGLWVFCYFCLQKFSISGHYVSFPPLPFVIHVFSKSDPKGDCEIVISKFLYIENLLYLVCETTATTTLHLVQTLDYMT